MDSFVCSVCKLTYPMTLNAFGVKVITVCSQCYEKTSEEANKIRKESGVKITLAPSQDNNPKE